jgi:hypothetical protein
MGADSSPLLGRSFRALPQMRLSGAAAAAAAAAAAGGKVGAIKVGGKTPLRALFAGQLEKAAHVSALPTPAALQQRLFL